MAPKLILLYLSLRLTVVPLSAVTIWLTVTNQQDNSTYVNLKFSNFSGLKYIICISAASAGFALAAALCTWVKCLACKSWLFFVPDQIITYLMVTSGAAVLEILNLAQNGDKEVTWSEACSSYGKFCNRMKLALIFHALSLCCFVVLAAISAYRAFSVFQTHHVPPKGEQVERVQGSIDFQS